MIKLQNLTKRFGDLKAIDDVSLEIKQNEIYGIIGLSGAGKSTLIRLINRLEEPDSGQIFINDREITGISNKELREERKNIGMIFQGFNLFSSRDVFKNIAYPLEISGWNKADIAPRVRELLKLVGIEDKEKSRISQLSGGQKQRVAIARALAGRPDILLCDEATSALDPQTTKAILSLIRGIKDELGLTVIIITHQMEVIHEICDKVAIMENGKIVASGVVNEVFSDPTLEIAKEFTHHLRNTTL